MSVIGLRVKYKIVQKNPHSPARFKYTGKMVYTQRSTSLKCAAGHSNTHMLQVRAAGAIQSIWLS